MLCRHCEKIRPPHIIPFDSESDNSEHWCLVKHWATFGELLDSAEDGCELCRIFRPFVESAKLRREERCASCDVEDRLDDSQSGYAHEDPFDNAYELEKKERIAAPVETYIYRTKDLVYLDEGHQYCLIDHRTDEKNDALIAQIKERAKEEQIEEFGPSPSRPSSPERNEAIQWLLQDPAKYTGPEQLWVKSWEHVGFGEDSGHLKERSTLFALTAGSLAEVIGSKTHLEYCVDDHVVARRQAEMARQYPGLWAHPFNPLHVKQKRPANDLRPVFEFFSEENVEPERMAKPPGSHDSVRAKGVPSDPRAAFPLLKSWLATCLKNHKRCQRDDSAAPTRLIRVLNKDGAPILQLVDSLDLMIYEQLFDIKWAILSHSWGTDRSVISTLTLANVGCMRQNIDESMLCPSFQDAITITRGLDLHFVWIDAMCIIQDSPEDWNAESSHMSEYYQGSQVTLSALTSESAADRMLLMRDHGPSATIRLEGRNLGVRRLLEKAVSVTPYLQYYSSPREDISKQPLSKRAWTFQEYTMAPRLIHFTKEQIIWQCTTCLASEDNQFSMIDNELPETAMERARMSKRTDRHVNKKARPLTLKELEWYEIVEKYTSRSITFTTDILPALGAVAQQVQHFTQLTYCAGLWTGNEYTFIYNLLWETDKRYGNPVRAQNGSPSWAWSSVRGKISFPFWQGIFRIARPYNPKILEIAVRLTSKRSPFGQVEHGSIDVVGWHHVYSGIATFAPFLTSRRRSRFTKHDNSNVEFHEDSHYLNTIPELSHSENLETGETCLDQKQLEEAYGFGDFDIPKEDQDENHSDRIILFISEYNSSPAPVASDGERTQFFLILQRKNVAANGVKNYVRVGVGSMSDPYVLDISTEHGWKRERLRIL